MYNELGFSVMIQAEVLVLLHELASILGKGVAQPCGGIVYLLMINITVAVGWVSHVM